MGHGSVREDVEEFVVARSGSLLRTAYLLTGDPDRAEVLLRKALAAAWDEWDHGELGPDAAVLTELVRRQPWSRLSRAHHGVDRAQPPVPPRPGDEPVALAGALARLPGRERAVLVLRHAEGLSEVGTATVLGCSSAAVRHLEARAVGRLRLDDPDRALAELTGAVPVGDVTGRVREVEHRARSRRTRRRRATVAATLLVLVAVPVATSLWPSASPEPDRTIHGEQMVETPETLLGRPLPVVLRRHNRDFFFERSEVSASGRSSFSVTLTPTRHEQALTWGSSTDLGGDMLLSVDGEVVDRGRAGQVRSGVVVSGRRSHVVRLRVTEAGDVTRLGIAVYR